MAEIIQLYFVLIYTLILLECKAQNVTGNTSSVTGGRTTTHYSTTALPQDQCKPGNANTVVDSLLEKLQTQMADVVPLPDIQHQLIQLTDGKIGNLNTIKRHGDSTLECGNGYQRITIPFTTQQPIATFYVWKHRLLPFISGSSTCDIKGLKGVVFMTYKPKDYRAKIDGIKIVDLGKLDVQLKLEHSNFVPTFFTAMVSKLTDHVITLLKPFLMTKIADVLTETLNNVLIDSKL